jgi:eukaryotic-like serine/threonine-protein kinase
VSVPNVVGERRGAAVNKLTAAGFKVNVVGTTSPGTPANTVVNEHPTGSAKPGATITIDVTAREPDVPASVIGMTAAQATALLQANPYDYVVTPQPGPGNGGAVGTVYLTSPPTGSPLAQGSAITIFVVEAPSSSPSVTPSNSASPNPSDSTTPPPGQGATTGQGTQSTPSPGASTKATNGVADGLGGALIDG